MTFSINQLKSNIFILVLMMGVFVHTFFIPIGVAFKFFYFVLIIYFYKIFIRLKIKKIDLVDKFFIAMFTYFLFLLPFSIDLFEHFITMVYLLNIIMVTKIVFGNFEFLKENKEKINLALFIIFGLGVVLFFYTIFFVGFEHILNLRESVEERRDLANTLVSLVWYEGLIIRYNGFYVDPNFWSFHLVFALMLLYSINDKNKSKMAKYTISITLFSIFLAFSRGSFVALILICVIYFLILLFFNRISSKVIVNIFKIIFTIILLSISLYLFATNTDIISSDFLFSRFSSDQIEGNSRTYKWVIYIDNLLNYDFGLLFGLGLSRVVNYFTDFSSHNVYIFMLYNFGLLGLSCFIIMILIILKRLLRKMNLNKEKDFKLYALSFSFIVGLLLQALFIDVFFTIPLWGIIVLGYSISKYRSTS